MTVAVGDTGDSATEGTDYATVSNFTVTIGANATSGTGTFTLTPTQDLLVEGDETISVKGTATGLTVTGASLTLGRRDGLDGGDAVGEPDERGRGGRGDGGGGDGGAARGRPGGGDGGDGRGGGRGDSATEGTDYATVSNFTVTIGANATSGTGTFTLTPTQDLLVEGDETISVKGTATGLTVTGASLTLTDDETASTG